MNPQGQHHVGPTLGAVNVNRDKGARVYGVPLGESQVNGIVRGGEELTLTP